MGFPPDTVELPRHDPGLAAVVERAALDPYGQRTLLTAALLAPQAGAAPRAPDDGGHHAPTPAASHHVVSGHLATCAWVIDERGEQALLVAHRVLGWCVPGGHVELGETLSDASGRELHEETGLELDPLFAEPALIHGVVFPAARGHPAHYHWNIGFLYVARPDAPLTGEPGQEPKWWPIDTLPVDAVSDLAPTLALLRRFAPRTSGGSGASAP